MMSAKRRNFIQMGNNSGVNMMETLEIQNLEQAPAANQAPAARVVVRRGPQLMVVFSGRPMASDVDALLLANVKIGLALSPQDLGRASSLDDYSYMFVGTGRKGSSPLRQAVADLAHNGWSIDDNGRLSSDLVEPRAPRTPVRTTELAMVHA